MTPLPQTNTPLKTLKSWKQIAAYLEASERTVRRWESSEGLPVHRHGHNRQDTIFAHRHELDAWTVRRTRFPHGPASPPTDGRANHGASEYLTEHDAITRAIHCYIAGARAGDPGVMKTAFHPDATIAGYCLGAEYTGSIQHVFDWIRENGPAPRLEPRVARIEIIGTIAVVHLEVQGWSGKLAGANARASDVFTLIKREGEWKITHKLFHWHNE